MKLFLLLISIFWLTIGITALLYPLKIKEFYSHIIKSILDPPTLCGGHSKSLFFLPLIFGILFLWARPASSLKPLISVLAAISFLKAIFLLGMPVHSLKKLLQGHTVTPFSVLQGRGGVYSGFRGGGWVECIIEGFVIARSEATKQSLLFLSCPAASQKTRQGGEKL